LEGNVNKTWLNLGVWMKIGMNSWERDVLGLRKTLPLISTWYSAEVLTFSFTGSNVAIQRLTAGEPIVHCQL